MNRKLIRIIFGTLFAVIGSFMLFIGLKQFYSNGASALFVALFGFGFVVAGIRLICGEKVRKVMEGIFDLGFWV